MLSHYSEDSFRAEGQLGVGDGHVITGKRVVGQEIGCIFHKKDGRFSVRYFEDERLLVVYCVACNPRNELLRAKIAKED